MDKLNIAVVGCGYWGPNLIRNFNQIPNSNMKICCDLDENNLKRMKSLYPNIETTTSLEKILLDPSIDGVAIATPVSTHFPIGKQVLEHKKHLFIEKPMAASTEESIQLIKLAEQYDRRLMVGHTFEYTAAVNKAKEIIDSGELGEIYNISCIRVNLGLFQQDINVIWDLAPHDISIILYLLNESPVTVNAQGKAHFKNNIEDVAMTTLNFPNGTSAFIHTSWLDPNKIRKITIVGSKKMLVYDDINPNEKIKIYDKGVEVPDYYDTYGEFQFSYRYGDIYTPRIQEWEPLRYECEHFLDSIEKGINPQSDGYSGLRVVSILEAANKSLQKNGAQQLVENDHFILNRKAA